MSLQPLTNAFYADIAQGRRCWVDSTGRTKLPAGEPTIIRGDKTFTVTLMDGGAAATMTGKTAANYALVLKDPTALNGTTLLASTGAVGGSVSLSGNVLTCTMPTNTTDLNTWLGADTSKTARLELVYVESGAEVAGPLASADVTVVADASRGTESTPTPTGNGLLAALSVLTLTANTIIEVTSTAGAVALRAITSFGKTLIACADAAAGRTALGLGTIATAAADAYALLAHTHAGTTNGNKLAQANTHESADTDAGASSLHHTIGTGANQAAAGDHAHSGIYEPANANIQSHIGSTSNPHAVTAAQANAVARSFLWGDGSDGALVYDAVDARWEDGDGAALSTVAGKWTVTGAKLELLRVINATSVTVGNGGTLVSGADNGYGAILLRSTGPVLVESGGVIRGAYRQGMSSSGRNGAAAKTTAGAGTAASTSVYTGPRAGRGGGGANGGGDGTNNGGSRTHVVSDYGDNDIFGVAGIAAQVAGNTGAGTAGLPGTSPSASFSYWTCPDLFGGVGAGGGSGALKQSGGSNASGAGGNGGRGCGPVNIRAPVITVDAGGTIHSNGENGTNGGDGVATNAAGDISGGGGGGGAGGGGTVKLLWGTSYTNNGTVSASAATGGTGGLGYEFNGTPRASSNGGNGGNSGAGLVVTEQALY